MSQVFHISEFPHYVRHWTHADAFYKIYQISNIIPSGLLNSGRTLVEFDRLNTFHKNPAPLDILGKTPFNYKENLLTNAHLFWGRYLCALYSGTLTYFHNPYENPLTFFYTYEYSGVTLVNSSYMPTEIKEFLDNPFFQFFAYPTI